MRAARIIVIAKAPVPGTVKTRLTPPYRPEQAADLAAAAIADTLAVVRAVPDVHRVVALDGDPGHPAVDLSGFDVLPQRGDGLGERLAHAFADSAGDDPVPTLLVGMDTPQLTAAALVSALRDLDDDDAVLGPAEDGGWWALGLRDTVHAGVLVDVPMSRADTGALTERALRARGLSVGALPALLDVDTVADALAVAALAPDTLFARAIRGLDHAGTAGHPRAGSPGATTIGDRA